MVISQENKLTGTGRWVDLEDLRKEFAGKPERLRSIEKNGTRWYDAKQEVELIEVMEYTTTNTSTLKRTIEESWKATSHETVKQIKTSPTPKAKAKAAATQLDGDSEALEISPKKSVTAAQLKWFEKAVLNTGSPPAQIH